MTPASYFHKIKLHHGKLKRERRLNLCTEGIYTLITHSNHLAEGYEVDPKKDLPIRG